MPLHTCPDCSIEMIDEVVEGVTLNSCPQCAGVWIHPEALKQILLQEPQALAELDAINIPKVEHKIMDTHLRSCPDCLMSLQNYHYCYDSPIVLQVCSECGGYWVEDGQLAMMEKWLDSSHKPTSKYEADLAMTAGDIVKHENFMVRQENLRGALGLMRRTRYGWIH